MTEHPQIERRKHPRVKVEFSGNLSHDANVIPATTKDISCSGACCVVDKHIKPMTRVEVTLVVPGKGKPRNIKCQGVVVRCEPLEKLNGKGLCRIGIYFVDIGRQEQEYINRYIQQAISESSPAR
ncbi:MAG: PilZ domain-containing protein [Candidatus Omnitrophica bacterium]|nr:PilZ domain-containing protein [Candidatus Omnitrophota bacterium]